MRFAEVFLRLGSALVAWMLLYAHFLWLAALHAMGCGPDGAEMHQLLLGLVPLTCGAALLLRATRPFEEIQRLLSWLAVPLLLLLPFALRSVWNVANEVYIRGASICGEGGIAAWEKLWAPGQIIALALALAMMLDVWRQSREKGDAAPDMD